MFPFLKKDEPVKINFLIDSAKARSRMTWDDLEAIESIRDQTITHKQLKHLAARFMANDKGEYLETDKALRVLGALNGEDIQDVLGKFFNAMQEALVPKARASDLRSLSEVTQEKTPPDGPQS